VLYSTYIPQVQDLLNDPLAQMWSQASLANYINEARNRVAQETKALRQVVTTAAYPTLLWVAGQELYPYATTLPTPFNTSIIDTMSLSCIVNNERYVMKNWAYTQLTAFLRGWVNYVDWPVAWARMGANQIYIAPVPNQNYGVEWDMSIVPQPLVLDTDLEPIPAPFQEPVQYYAAYKAKLKLQAQGEAKYFFDLYQEILRRCCKAWNTRMVQNPYASVPR
jgi:hypothetical protein